MEQRRLSTSDSLIVISVIISTYNQARSVLSLLKSLMKQQHSPIFEIIICDDGSMMSEVNVVLDTLRANTIDVRYIWQPDNGFRLSRSRNNGIRSATGRILVFLDADVIASPTLIQAHALAHTSADKLVCGSRVRIPKQASVDIEDWSKYNSSYNHQEMMRSTAEPWNAVIGCNFSVCSSADLFFDESFTGWGCEDRELACRLISRHGYTAICDSTAVVWHLEEQADHSSAMRPCRADDISRYISNLCYFCMLYPDQPMGRTWNAMRYFDLSTNLNVWCRSECSIEDVQEIKRRVGIALKWYQSSLPTP